MPQFLFLTTLLLVTLISAPANSQSTTAKCEENWTSRQQLQQEFAAKLAPIVKAMLAEGSNADALRRLLIPRDPQRQYVFLPPENVVGVPAVTGLGSAQSDIENLLQQHAEKLYRRAAKLAEQGMGCAAIQCLNEVLFFDPNHDKARKALGHRVIDVDGKQTWRVKSDRLKLKLATRRHPEFKWPAKQYLTVSTARFQIASRCNEQQTRELARNLELWHDVWSQVFFSYFDRAKNILRRMEGKAKPPSRNRKYKVVFFSNRQDYIRSLQSLVPGVEGSAGYYDDKLRTSFFYAADDPAIQDTWRHELTHQLLQESRRSMTSPFENQHLWIGEGIAMYFESLVNLENKYAIVGGFDARRLQYARLRRLKEQFSVPLKELAMATKQQFQAMSDLPKVYSQSAGVAHYLMDSHFGAMREPLNEFLRLSYQGKLKPDSFEKIVGLSYREIEKQYDQFLRVDAETLAGLVAAQQRTELCLTGAQLDDASLRVLQSGKNLRWLDLSGCDVRDDRLSPLRSCNALKQLFLTGSRLNKESANRLAQLPVVELDLSGSNLTDEGLRKIAAGAPHLETLNVAGTNVSSNGIKTFSSKRPEVKIVSNFNKR